MAGTSRSTGALGRVADAARLRLRAGVRAGLLATALALPAPLLAQVPATLMADQVFVDAAGRLIATGAVEVWHGSIRLTAARVTFDRRQDRLDVEGPLTISDGPDQVFLADAAQLSPALRAGIITGARIVLDQQLQVAAARLERSPDGTSEMQSVIASSCPVCATNPTPLWEIRADRVVHDDAAGRLRFHRAQFRFAGVPVFYVPRMDLPAPGNPRLRGFLRPDMSLDSELGLVFGIPYFIPFGEAQDLTLTPSLSSGGMVSMGFRWRMARQNGGIELGGQLTHDDLVDRDLRGYGYARALFHLRDGWVLTGDVTIPSDRTYLDTYDISSDAQLQGHLTLQRIRRDQALRARLLGFYSLREGDENDELPNAAVQADLQQYHTLAGGALSVTLGASALERASTADGVGRDVARASLGLGWRRSAVMAGGVLATAALDARVDHVAVSNDPGFTDPVTRRAIQGMIEFRWPWAATTPGGVRHVIEPVLQVIGAERRGGLLPNDDHTMPELDGGNLFALTRYSGNDAPDDGSRVNAGLHWTRYAASGWSAEALAGRIWRRDALEDFDTDHRQPLGTGRSDWLLAGRVTHPQGHAVTLRALMDEDNRFSRAEANVAWSSGPTLVSTSYLYVPANPAERRDVDLSEWSMNITRRLTPGWSTTLGWDYDFGEDTFATARTGFTFRNECLAFDMTLSRNFVTTTNPSASTRFNMRVELLGIGGRAPSTGGRTCRA